MVVYNKLWFNFIQFKPIGFNYIFLCLKLIIILKTKENNIQNKYKIKPQHGGFKDFFLHYLTGFLQDSSTA